ncbi:two-component system sensor histidine kinase CreC [Methylomagnum sp.]
MSARGRVFLSLILVFLLGLGWLVQRNIEVLEQRYRESAEELLVDTAQLVAALVATDIQNGGIQADRLRLAIPALHKQRFEARIFQAIKRDVNLRLYLTDAAGRVIYHSEGRHEGEDFRHWRDVQLTLQGQYGARTSRDSPDEPDSSVMWVGAPVVWNGEIIGVASVGKPTSSHLPFIEAARKNLVAGGASAGLAVVLAGLAVAVWMVRPFGLVTEYLRLFRNRERAALPRLSRSALGLLGAAYDEMRDALAGRNYVEEYVQALTHELKSPLSAIRGAAELLAEDPPPPQRARFLANIQAESGRIQDLAERLLELADLEKRHRLTELARLELGPLIRDTLDSLHATAAARAVAFHVETPDGCRVNGDRFLLQRALANLLHNALEFSPEGGAVEISVHSAKRHHDILIRDHGPGLPAFAEKRVFERFYSLPRPATGRKSTGLGLSFVREIADLHHGAVDLRNHPDGGALAVLRLPRRR